ncbi:hypothetical protein HYALB_00006080 [Hymenoscyphus albidus]|uniref:Uncharacterized protein n=1 Tax=Hymenoscyphus albidus TaxID=595503 RepID=A0A9N9M0D8_9HELO|nr:hypothetical protein HYALB_00006080 [Hymenoscyphus albidus]
MRIPISKSTEATWKQIKLNDRAVRAEDQDDALTTRLYFGQGPCGKNMRQYLREFEGHQRYLGPKDIWRRKGTVGYGITMKKDKGEFPKAPLA